MNENQLAEKIGKESVGSTEHISYKDSGPGNLVSAPETEWTL